MDIDSLQSTEEVKQSESQVVNVSVTMESNEEENACTNLLQEENDEELCKNKYPVAPDKVVNSVGGEFTSSFFVRNL